MSADAESMAAHVRSIEHEAATLAFGQSAHSVE